MILFYDKRNGKILATIDGRVHNKKHINCKISDGSVPLDKIEKFIIGWEESDEIENHEIKVEEFIEISKDVFRKVEKKKNEKRTKLCEHNLKFFHLLQKFESLSEETPFDYKLDIKTVELIKLK